MNREMRPTGAELLTVFDEDAIVATLVTFAAAHEFVHAGCLRCAAGNASADTVLDVRQGVDLVSQNMAGGEGAVHVPVVPSDHRIDVVDVMTFDEDGEILSLRTYTRPSNVLTLQRS